MQGDVGTSYYRIPPLELLAVRSDRVWMIFSEFAHQSHSLPVPR